MSGHPADPGWHLGISPAIAGNFLEVASGDLDQDGCEDLVLPGFIQKQGEITSPAPNHLITQVKQAGGCTGTFIDRTDVLPQVPTNQVRGAVIEDLNGDGYPDILFAQVNGVYYPGPTGYVLLVNKTGDNNGVLTLANESFRVHLPEVGDPHHSVACDVNADGLIDIVQAVNRMGDEARDRLLIQHVDEQTADWWFEDEADLWGLPFETYGWSHDVECVDLVGSPLPDLVIARRGGQKSWLFENTGTSFLDRTSLLPDVQPNTQGVSVCELNGAGKPEILFANGDVMLWTRESSAALTFDPGAGEFVDISDELGFNFAALPSLTETMECADVNSDGLTDVMVVNIGLRKWLYLGHGNP